MRVSYEWLREYINTKIRAENIGSLLTMVGLEVTAIEQKTKDFIFEIEVTPNRPDCLCYIGIARELSAAIKKALKLPKVAVLQKAERSPFKVSLIDETACPRYSIRIITDIEVSSSPRWLVKRMEAMGLRPVNNIVDITNFVLFETGQPLHAFDLDRLSGEEIVIRKAKPGEKILTIDGVERELKPHMLVIADERKPVAIAGVMGGKETEITEKTKNILLESAYFEAAGVRKTALSLGLSTDSSYRFERGLDLAGVVQASDRAASLICKIAKADVGALIDVGMKKKYPNEIILRTAQVNKILGTKLKTQQIKAILQRLGFKSKGSSRLEVVVPTFRDDVTREADIIEEIARIYGYEDITLEPPNIMATEEEAASKDVMDKEELTKTTMVSLGFHEIITYSLVSKEILRRMDIPEEGVIEIQNPLSKEQEIMRPSLLPGLIKTVSHNLSRQIQDIRIFELSNIYFLKETTYNEEPFLAFAEYEKAYRGKDYLSSGIFELKGAITSLGNELNIASLGFEVTHHPLFVPDESMAVLSGDVMLGTMGRIKDRVLEAFDIKGELYIAELNFKTMVDHSNLNRFYRPLPRFPYSYRDISFSIDNIISYKEVVSLIKNTGGSLVERVELLSEYRGEQIPENQRALAFRIIYRSKEKTLAEDEINRLDEAIRTNLTRTLTATLR